MPAQYVKPYVKTRSWKLRWRMPPIADDGIRKLDLWRENNVVVAHVKMR